MVPPGVKDVATVPRTSESSGTLRPGPSVADHGSADLLTAHTNGVGYLLKQRLRGIADARRRSGRPRRRGHSRFATITACAAVLP